MTTTNKENTANETMVTCYKCAGSGLFYFAGGATGTCYPCEGSGLVEACKVPAPRAPRPRDLEQTRLQLRGWYRNATLPANHPCFLTLADVLDERDGMGWTIEGFSAALDAVPGSREAFRAIGWAV